MVANFTTLQQRLISNMAVTLANKVKDITQNIISEQTEEIMKIVLETATKCEHNKIEINKLKSIVAERFFSTIDADRRHRNVIITGVSESTHLTSGRPGQSMETL